MAYHNCLLMTHMFFPYPANQSFWGDGKLWQGKRETQSIYIYIYTLLETQPITSREYISREKPVFNIGLMPHLLENAHALLNRAMNLVKEDVKHLNPNQTPVLTMNQLPRGGDLHAEMAWRVVKWFWVARCNHNCRNSVAESFVKTSHLARTRHAHQQQSAFLSYVVLSPNMLSTPNSGKHRWRVKNSGLNSGLLFLVSSSVSLGLCTAFVVVTTICEMSN